MTNDRDAAIRQALAGVVVWHRARPQPPVHDAVVWTHTLHPDHVDALVPVVRRLVDEAQGPQWQPMERKD